MANTKFCPNCSSKNITHEFQDKAYGKFMRIFNSCGKDGKKARCTICGNTIDVK